MKLGNIIALGLTFGGVMGILVSVTQMMDGDQGAFGTAVVIGACTFGIASAFARRTNEKNEDRDPEFHKHWIRREIKFKEEGEELK